MKKRRLLSIFAIVISLVMISCAMLACTDNKDDVTVTISATTTKVKVGVTKQLTAEASDGSSITWSTSDETKVTVTESGLIKGIAVGTATITAASGDAKATCEVTVEPITLRVTISSAAEEIEVGDTVTLTAETTDGSSITWSSSDTTVATVVNGVVTGVKEGNATITATSGAESASCEVSVIPKDSVIVDIAAGTEAEAVEAPGTYIYWADLGWVGASFTTLKSRLINDKAEFEYLSTGGPVWFGFQVFYKNPTNVADKHYNITMKLNSSVAGDITVNGTVVTLVVGNNDISVYAKETAGGASLSLQMGTAEPVTMIGEATIKISDLAFTEFTPTKLVAPSAITIDENKVVTITGADEGKASGYKLYFYSDDVLAFSMDAASGDTIDDSTMEDGEYVVKVQAIGQGQYADSDISTASATLVVENGGIAYELTNQTETDANKTLNKFAYWTDYGTVTGDFDNGTLTFEFENNAGNWYCVQLFYKSSSLATGDKYTLSFNLNSTAAGRITINGNVVDLVVGDNEVELELTQGTASTISIQMGLSDGTIDIEAAAMVFTDISIVKETTEPEPGEGTPISNGEEATSIANPGAFIYWNDQNWCGSNVSVTTAKIEDDVATLSYTSTGHCWFGFQVFYTNAENVAGDTYVVTLTLNSTVAGNITVNGQKITLIVGDNEISVEYTQEAKNASLSIQMGVEADNTMVQSATIIISDLEFTPAA